MTPRSAGQMHACPALGRDRGRLAGVFLSLLISRNRHNRSGPFFSGLHQGEDKHHE